MAKKTSTTRKKQAAKKESELIAIELPSELVKGMEMVGINNQEEYITFLIASSLLNYQKIFKDEEAEKQIEKLKRTQTMRIISGDASLGYFISNNSRIQRSALSLQLSTASSI